MKPTAFGRLLTFKVLFSISGRRLAFGSQVLLVFPVDRSFAFRAGGGDME